MTQVQKFKAYTGDDKACYAYTPGSESSEWKLPVCDSSGKLSAAQIGAAAASLGGGFRGQKVDLPSSSVSGVKAKVRAAWKKVHSDASEDDMPEGIKATEVEDFLYDEYSASSAYTPPKLQKSDVRVEYREAVSEDEAIPKDTPACYNCRYYGWGSCALVEGTIEANDVCNLFTEHPLVAPVITLHDVTHKGKGNYGLFWKQSFKEVPEWIHYYPAPQRFVHPEYGEIVVTEERNAQIVDNFHNSGYQKNLPVDVDHDLEWSGAVGWITDMRLAGDGSVEAKVDWTENGQELLAQDRYRYFSPSVIRQWPHIVTGEKYANLAIGGAICTRPFFKEDWLRPLVASEGDLTVYDFSEAETEAVKAVVIAPVDRPGDKPMPEDPKPVEKPPVVQQFSDAEVQAFREFQSIGGKGYVEKLKEEITSLQTQQNADRQKARREKFTQMVRGKDGADDGAPWAGEVDYNVDMLIHLADTSGEESDLFNKHLAAKRAEAQELKKSATFKELGDPAGSVAGSATEQIEQYVRTYMSEDSQPGTEGEKRARAMSRASREHRETYNEYRNEARKLGMTGE